MIAVDRLTLAIGLTLNVTLGQLSVLWLVFFAVLYILCFYRATRMHSADYSVASCPSVRLSHAGIESKRLYISSNFSHRRVAPPF